MASDVLFFEKINSPFKMALTLFSCPKPFRDHIGIIQRNAIESWRRLDPSVEIILFGDEAGTSETAREVGARHIPDIKKNEYGTPLLDEIFKKAHREARNDVLCYVNADIILLGDFLRAVNFSRFEKNTFLLVGRRWDLDIHSRVIFSEDWDTFLREQIRRNGRLHPPSGSDFFVYPRQLFSDIPPFAVGRAGWDNWMIYNSRMKNIPVIDISPVTTIIHQNHDYRHVKKSTDNKFENIESAVNREIIGDPRKTFVLDDATYILTPRGLKRNILKNSIRKVINVKISFYLLIKGVFTKLSPLKK